MVAGFGFLLDAGWRQCWQFTICDDGAYWRLKGAGDVVKLVVTSPVGTESMMTRCGPSGSR